MTTYYLGLATTPHDPALAIVNPKGEVVFAEGAERYLQNKRGWCSPPDDFLRIESLFNEYCQDATDLVIARSWQKPFINKLYGSLNSAGEFLKQSIGPKHYYHFRACVTYLNNQHGVNAENHFRVHHPNANVSYREYNHHLTHAAAACYSSPFDNAMCLVVDGFGENNNISAYHFNNDRLELLSTAHSSGSLGEFYSMICELCGFDPSRGEEWKVMGLAPYGKLNSQYYEVLKQYLLVDGITLQSTSDYVSVLRELEVVGYRKQENPIDYADLAYTGQHIFSEVLDQLLKNLAAKGLSDNIVLAGGCALNSVYVGTIETNTPFKRSYIFCAPADDGNAVGAAYLAYLEDNPACLTREKPYLSPFLGSNLNKHTIEKVKSLGGLAAKSFADDQALADYVALKISQGAIIGWAQGRAEFGPRSLGNRSILADPRRASIKQTINAKVKFREAFRPFAPAILHEYGSDYFEHYVDTPYMERALQFKQEMKDKVPGVIHVDGTGRLQSVHRQMNHRFYLLIESFFRITGIPLLLNTSFNVMGKPIIHSVEDAIAVFFTSGIDLLVLEDFVFDKGN